MNPSDSTKHLNNNNKVVNAIPLAHNQLSDGNDDEWSSSILIGQLLHHGQRRAEWMERLPSSSGHVTPPANSDVDGTVPPTKAAAASSIPTRYLNMNDWKRTSKYTSNSRNKDSNSRVNTRAAADIPTMNHQVVINDNDNENRRALLEDMPDHLQHHLWRHRSPSVNDNDNDNDRHLDSNNGNPSSIGTIRLANCHLESWSGSLSLGTSASTPTTLYTPQKFTVQIDTGSTELWIPSTKCVASDCQNPQLNLPLYDQSASTTYSNDIDDLYKFSQPDNTDDRQEHSYEYYDRLVLYRYYKDAKHTFTATFPIEKDNEYSFLSGMHGKDTLHLGATRDGINGEAHDITVENQVFAQVLNFTEGFYGDCGSDNLGRMGLGLADYTPHGYPTLLSNLKRNQGVKNNVFGLYLDASHDDQAGLDKGNGMDVEKTNWETWVYDDDDDDWLVDDDADPDQQHEDALEKKKNKKLIPDASELVFGGVNQRHYKGCLNWHLVNSRDQHLEGLWEFPLADVQVGGQSMEEVENGLYDDYAYDMDDDDDDGDTPSVGGDGDVPGGGDGDGNVPGGDGNGLGNGDGNVPGGDGNGLGGGDGNGLAGGDGNGDGPDGGDGLAGGDGNGLDGGNAPADGDEPPGDVRYLQNREIKERPPASYALLDSGSSFLIGPAAGMGIYAAEVGATCFTTDPTGLHTVVNCLDSDVGFDTAMIDCETPLLSLDFIPYDTSGEDEPSPNKNKKKPLVYSLEKDDLLVLVETFTELPSGIEQNIEYCMMRIVGSPTAQGYVLGVPFLNKYYAAFDFDNGRIGLAPATQHSDDSCPEDVFYEAPQISTAGATKQASVSTFSPNKTTSGASATLIVIAILVVGVNLYLLYRRFVKRRKQKQNVFGAGEMELSDTMDFEFDKDEEYNKVFDNNSDDGQEIRLPVML
mmetsp:Transcript_60441/g.70690  ORF Transcript_60441/g.70690 Transcript_60441/m.70690 type:complete len:921 (+) Transcript_60441:202-2964(+)